MSDMHMVAKDRPHAKQMSMPSGKIFRHLGQVNSLALPALTHTASA